MPSLVGTAASSLVFGLFLVALLGGGPASAAIPDYIQVCSKSDPDVNKCIINSIVALKPKLLEGIPELNVPSYEPLIIPEIILNRGPKAAKLIAKTYNMSVYGPSTFILQNLKSDLKNNRFDAAILLPRLNFVADYDLDVFILGLPIRGKGRLRGNFTDYKSSFTMKGNLIKKNGEEYLEFEKMNIKFLVGKSKLYLEGLFGGESALGEAVNTLLSDNANLFIEELKPLMEDALADLFTDIANKITLAFTYRELFPE